MKEEVREDQKRSKVFQGGHRRNRRVVRETERKDRHIRLGINLEEQDNRDRHKITLDEERVIQQVFPSIAEEGKTNTQKRQVGQIQR